MTELNKSENVDLDLLSLSHFSDKMKSDMDQQTYFGNWN